MLVHFCQKKDNYSLEKHQSRKTNPAVSTLSNVYFIQPPNNDTMFTEVQELLIYDQQERNHRCDEEQEL